jgi:acyl-CoA synthetase (AMP-forming)/AMP-acid ligase II
MNVHPLDQTTSDFAPAGSQETLLDILARRAELQSDRRAYTFLLDGESQEQCLTYRELQQRVLSIGARIQQFAQPGERALLLYPPGLEYVTAFLGCLHAGVIAVPAYPPTVGRAARNLPRLRAIVTDAQATLALTQSALLGGLTATARAEQAFQSVRWLATDEIDESPAHWRKPDLSPSSIAFLQYTSGSTAAPKGVMVSHGNLVHNEKAIQQAFGLSERSVVLGWLPLYHDMGLIGNVLQPLSVGAPCILMSPVAFLQRPARWLRAISKYRATTSGGPNFAYDLCVRKITPEQQADLDLSSWTVAFNGAEPVRADTLERFATAFASRGFRPEAFLPCYGLAEGTLIVAGARHGAGATVDAFHATALEQAQALPVAPDAAGARVLVSSGSSVADQQLKIVDPDARTECPDGRVGEIWVAGPSVATGYWNQPEESARTFDAYQADTGAGPFLRTGDLGFMRDAQLFVAGRRKDLIIIDGRNHHPGDVERTVEESHPALQYGAVAAFSVDIRGEERLVVAAELQRSAQTELQRGGLDRDSLLTAIRRAVTTHHDIHAHDVMLLKIGSLPKTSSGKVQRHACRAGFLARTLESL